MTLDQVANNAGDNYDYAFEPSRRDLLSLLEARAHNGDFAFKICAQLEGKLIAILGRYGLGRFDAELTLHDALREHERALFAAMRDRIHLDDARDAVACVLGSDE